MKRGQAAMEFLMTYGWAILVVLAAIAALAYFGILSPARFLPERCTGPAGLDCLEKATFDATNNYISWAIKNNEGKDINLTGLSTIDTTTKSCGSVSSFNITIEGTNYDTFPVRLNNGKKALIEVHCSNDFSTGRASQDFKLEYLSLETGLTHSATYDMVGKAT